MGQTFSQPARIAVLPQMPCSIEERARRSRGHASRVLPDSEEVDRCTRLLLHMSIDDPQYAEVHRRLQDARCHKWTDGTLPYCIAEEVPVEKKTLVEEAVAQLNEATRKCGLKIVERTIEHDYVAVVWDERTVSSMVGCIGGRQPLTIAPWVKVGNIMHEFCHAVGLLHEHQRHDRDLHVAIGNSHAGDEVNYGKAAAPEVEPTASTVPCGLYDLDSIMHYGPCQGVGCAASNSHGQRVGLSQGDLDAIAFMYRAPRFGCTYDVTGHTARRQQFYHCKTCWGDGRVRYCCCGACATRCHDGHDLETPIDDGVPNFCDCGACQHQLVCTKQISRDARPQALFRCVSCTSAAVCLPCARACHADHVVSLVSTSTVAVGICECSGCVISSASASTIGITNAITLTPHVFS